MLQRSGNVMSIDSGPSVLWFSLYSTGPQLLRSCNGSHGPLVLGGSR